MIVNCKFCNKEVNKLPSQIKKYKNCFCSNKCRDLFRDKKATYNCENCGKEFKRSKRHISIRKFCSHQCHGDFCRVDLTGQTFGQFKVIGVTEDQHKRSTFKCQCSCGGIYDVLAYNLIKGKSTKCTKCKNRKYVGEVPGVYFSTIRYRAKAENKPFNITQKDIWEKFLEQDRKCALSKVELTWQDGYKDDYGTASVDRIDSKLGYVKGNIQILHKTVNKMKMNLDQEEFIKFCRLIGLNNPE